MPSLRTKLFHRPSRKHTDKQLAYILIAIGIIAALCAILLTVHQHDTTPRPPADSKQAAPSSVKPSAKTIAAYNVAPTLPKYISIPAIGIGNTRVLQLGLMSNGQIAVPDNIYDTGWYDDSAKPGQQGAMFIYGHVSSWTANGIFYNLKKLVAGNRVVITRGDNKTYTYQVVALKVYPYKAVNMKAVLAPINPDKPGLNLMTCTGQVISGTSEFNERLVVFTSLVKTS